MKRALRATVAVLLAGVSLASASAAQVSGDVKVWSWNIGVSSLKAVVPGFNKQFPNVKVSFENLSSDQVFEKTQASCAAGGDGRGVTVLSDGTQHVRAEIGKSGVRLYALDWSGEGSERFLATFAQPLNLDKGHRLSGSVRLAYGSWKDV